MTTVIDERVVEMKFDNAQFERNVAQSISTLDKLKQALNIETGKGLKELGKAADSVNMDGLSNTLGEVQAKFSALQVIGITALSEITKAVMNTGASIVKGIIEPIKTGGMTRAMNIEQAKFQLKGLGVAWEDVGDDINYAVDGTAYGLDVAAKAAAQLSASNVQLGDDMKAGLRGISGVAAMTGSSYEEIARIFTTVAGNGRAMNGELNRIGERGLNAGAAIAKYFNGVADGTIEAKESVKRSVAEITGGLKVTEADIKEFAKKGVIDFELFSYAMDSAFGEHAKAANETFSGALSNMKAALSRIGAEFAAPYMESMRNIYNSTRIVLNGIKKDLAPVVEDYKYFLKIIEDGIVKILDNEHFNNGVKNIIDAVRYAFWDLYLVIRPIGDAFLEIFPAKGIKNFEEVTAKIRDLAAKMYITETDAKNLKDTFKGLFSIVRTVGDIFTALLKAIFPSMNGLKSFTSVVLALTGTLGRAVTWLSDFIRQTKVLDGLTVVLRTVLSAIGNILVGVGTAIAVIVGLIAKVIGYFGAIISGIKETIVQSSILERTLKVIEAVVKTVIDTLKMIGIVILGSVAYAIASFVLHIQKAVDTVKSFIKNSETLRTVINTVKEALSKAQKTIVSFLDNLKETIKNIPFLSTVSEHIISVIDRLRDKISNLGAGINENRSLFEKFVDVLKTVGAAIEVVFLGLIAIIAKALVVIKDFVISAIENFKKLGSESSTIFEKIGNGIKAICTTIKDFVQKSGIADFFKNLFGGDAKKESDGFFTSVINKVKEFITNIDLAKAAALAFVGIMGAVGISFIKLSKSASGTIGQLGSLIKDIRTKLTGSKTQNMLNGIEQLAKVIAILAASLYALSKIPAEDLKRSVITISLLTAGLAALVGVITAISAVLKKKKIDADLTKASTAFLMISGSIAIVVAALTGLAMLKLDGDELISLIEKLVLTIGAMVGLTAILGQISKYSPNISKGALTIIACAAAFKIIVDSLGELVSLPLTNIEDWLLALLPIFTGLGIVLIAASKLNTSKGALSILAAAVALRIALPALYDVLDLLNKDIPVKPASVAIIIAGIAALTLVCNAIAKAATGLAAIAAIIAAMGVSIWIVSKTFMELTTFFESLDKESKSWIKATAAIVAITAGLGLFAILFAAFAKMDIDSALPKLIGFSILLITFSGAVSKIASVVELLAPIPWTSLTKAIGGIGALGVILGLVMKIAGSADKTQLVSAAAIIVGISVLVGEMIVLTGIPTEELAPAFIALTGVMLSFAILLKVINEMGKSAKESLFQIGILVAVAGAMILIGKQIGELAQYPWQSLAAAGGAMAGAMLALTAVIAVLKNATFDESVLWAALTACGIIVSIGASLYLAAQHPWESIAAAGATMAVVMGVVTGMFAVLKNAKIDPSVLLGMLTACGILVSIGLSLSLAAQHPWESIAAAGGSMAVVMATVIGMFAVLGKVQIPLAALGAMVTAAILLISIGASLYLVAQNPWEQILAAAGAMTLVMIAVTAALAILSNMNGIGIMAASLGMIAMAAAFVVFAAALNMFNTVDWASLGKAGAVLGVITVVLAALGAISAIPVFGQAFILGMLAATAAFIGIGIAFTAMAAATYIIAAALEKLVPVFRDLISLDVKTLVQNMEGMAKAGLNMVGGAVGVAAMAAAILLLNAALKVLVPLLTAAIPVIQAFQQLFGSGVANSIASAAKSMASGIVAPFKDIGAKFKGFMNDIKSALGNNSAAIATANKTGTLLGNNILNPFRKVLGWHSPPEFILKFFQDLTSGIKSGSGGSIDTIKGIGSDLGGGLINSFKDMAGGFDLSGFINSLLSDLNINFDFTTMLNSDTTAFARYAKQTEKAKLATEGARNEKFMLKQTEKEATEATDELADAMGNFSVSAGKAGGSAKDVKDDFQDMYDKIESGISIFDEFDAKTEMTAEKMLENMRSQVNGVQTWASNIETLSHRAISEGLLRELAEMGPSGYEKVNAFVNMTDSQLQEANSLYATSLELPKWGADKMVNSFKNAANYSVEGMANGFKKHDQVTKEVGAMDKDAQAQLKEDWQYGSPSKVTYQMGQWSVEGLRNGIVNTIPLAEAACRLLAQRCIKTLESILTPDAFYKIGQKAVQGLRNGIVATTYLPVEATEAMAKKIKAMAESILNEPNFNTIGQTICYGLKAGIEARQDEVITAAKNLADATKKSVDDTLTLDAFKTIGLNVGKGLIKGIEDMWDSAVDKARKLAEAVSRAANDKFEINSPSKVFRRMGRGLGEGLVMGIDDIIDDSKSASERLADETIDSMQSALDKLESYINNTVLTMSPVITPSIDTSYLKEQASEISDLFNNNAIGVGAKISQNGAAFSTMADSIGNTAKTPNEINFTQNNYSPKSLSRYEIYRQTQNQISMLKGAMA